MARRRVLLRLAVLLLALPLVGGAALSDARVHLDNGRVSIHSRSAPLSEVLARFAQATGAEVVYEATRPRQLVTVVIDDASPAEAIARLLEGQGLNYALRLDRTGRNVELLVVSGSGGPSTAGAGAPRASAPPRGEEPFEAAAEDAEEPFAPDVVEDHEAVPPAPASTDDGTRPPPTAPFGGSAPGSTPGPDPASSTGGVAPSSAPAPEPAPPLPPAAASYPAAPAVPPPPVNPGPASYPRGE